MALILAALGHRVTAIDLSTDMLELASATANSRSVEIQFTSGDAVQPAFDMASFDLVTCRHLLWTLREPDRALANWRALLRPGGSLVAFDGFWFDPEPGPRDDEPEPFRRHYTADTRPRCPSCTSIVPTRSSLRWSEVGSATLRSAHCPTSPTIRGPRFRMSSRAFVRERSSRCGCEAEPACMTHMACS